MTRFVALLAAAVWTWSGCADDTVDLGVRADCGPRAVEVQAAGPELPPAPIPERDELAAYLLAQELAVVPLARQERAGEARAAAEARYASIAADVASEARNLGGEAFPREPADVAAAHLGVVLVAIAAHETGLLLALDGDSRPCPVALGGCDGGYAHGLWQLHADPGHDRAYYLRRAAPIAARSLHETGGLCQYTASCGVSPATRDIEGIYRARWAAAPWRQP